MMDYARNAYLEAEILSAAPTRLIQILFDQAVRSTANARDFLRKQDILNRGRQINQAYAILTELLNSLDFERGGDIAKNYGRLYDYCQRQLLAAHQQASDTILAEVESLLRDIAEAWSIVHLKETSSHQENLLPATGVNSAELTTPRVSFSF